MIVGAPGSGHAGGPQRHDGLAEIILPCGWNLGLSPTHKSVVLKAMDYHVNYVELEKEDIILLYRMITGEIDPETVVAYYGTAEIHIQK